MTIITSEMIEAGINKLWEFTYGDGADDVVGGVFTAMRELEPAPVPAPAALPWLQTVPAGVHPDSARLANLLYNSAWDRPNNWNIWDTYGRFIETANLPLYFVAASRGNLVSKSVRFNSIWPRNDWHSDRQMFIVCLDGTVAEFYDVTNIDHVQKRITCSRADRVAADLMQHPPSRGVGIPYHHMLITEEEAVAGDIQHALSLRVRGPHCTQAWWPASKVEGTTGCTTDGIPEGARFTLTISQSRIEAWIATKTATVRAFARAVVAALQTYGAFVTDNGGGSGGFDLQGPRSWQQDTPLRALALSNFNALRDVLDGLIQPGDITFCPEIGPRVGS